MLIPQSISYATSLAKLSPVTGLVRPAGRTIVSNQSVAPLTIIVWQISASVPGIVYAFLGTSRQLNVAPEAATSLLLGQAIADVLHDDKNKNDAAWLGLTVATAVTLQVRRLLCFHLLLINGS
jgi:MFS superfamily sulfate permease-like transporter